MRYFDLHCDTAARFIYKNTGLYSSSNHVSIDKTDFLDKYAQAFASFAYPKLSNDEGYDKFVFMYDNLAKEVEKNSDKAVIVKNAKEFLEAEKNDKIIILPAVEDARIIDGHMERLDVLKERGVWYLTMLWGGNTVIGGSHNTDNGLTDFGKAVVRRCFEINIVPDISHASEKSATDILEIAEEVGKPVIASHSNSHTVYSHSRNLRDYHLKQILSLGGVVGVSLCDSHLADKPEKETNSDDVLRHIEYYLSNGCENSLCIGADWDGTSLPNDIHDIRDIAMLYEKLLVKNYSEELLDKIFYLNARNFYINNL